MRSIARAVVGCVFLGCVADSPAPQPEEIAAWSPRTWYLDRLAGPARLSPGGQQVAWRAEGEIRVLDRTTGSVATLGELAGFEAVYTYNWLASGERIEFKGHQNGELRRAVFDPATGEILDSDLPRNIFGAQFSVDGSVRAGLEPRHRRWGLYVDHGASESEEPVLPGTEYTGWALSPDGARVAYTEAEEDGWGSLYLLDLGERRSVRLATDLDLSYTETPLRFSPDGRRLFLSLVDHRAGSRRERHSPRAARDLDIWAVEIETVDWVRVVDEPGDDLVSDVRADGLYWTNLDTSMTTRRIRVADGQVRSLTDSPTAFPHWHPDGDRVSVMWGDWRLADWALDWDIGEAAVEGADAGTVHTLVGGFHEDYSLAWSPDGRWMAYHSHRSDAPVARYDSPGSTDAIWLRAAAGGNETRISGEGHVETLQPEWSPEGDRLLFCSMGEDRPYGAFVLTIDRESGEPRSEERLELPAISGGILAAEWSPTRRDEIFLEEDAGEGKRALWRAGLDGGEAQRLAEFESPLAIGGIDVSPDGELVAFAGLAEGHHQLFLIGRDGGAPRQVTYAQAEWITPQFSPDGAWLAATVYTHTHRLLRLPATGY
jgi:Tol biopolymer transport system component